MRLKFAPRARALWRHGLVRRYSAGQDLPRLPIPKLEDTMERFVATVDPLLRDENERRETRRTVDEFLGSAGPSLQQLLLEYDASPEYVPDRRGIRGSFAACFWDDMYLESRDPVPVAASPFFTLAQEQDARRQTQARRAASLLHRSADFARRIADGALATPGECPSQYHHLFRTVRFPRRGRDAFTTYSGSRHVTVLHKGRFFALPILTEGGVPVPEEALARALEGVLSQLAPEPGPSVDLSTLTQLPRCGTTPLGPAVQPLTRFPPTSDDWARLYSALWDTSEDNRRALTSLGSSLFHLVLEDRIPASESERCECDGSALLPTSPASRPSPHSPLGARLMLHGAGRGRWFDKSASLVVFPDGGAGMGFEHSWGDGQTLMRWANDVALPRSEDDAGLPADAGPGAVEAQPVSLDTGEYARRGLQRAEQHAGDLAASVSMDARWHPGLGKQAAKENGLSPDATYQVAYQRALWRTLGFVASSYETCSTKHFHHGRTETIRPCTHEALEFARVDVNDPRASRLLRGAVDAHVAVARRAQGGEGIDRHLIALRKIAAQRGLPEPPLFSSAAYQRMMYDWMTSSNLSSPAIEWFGFGPSTPDCYGLGYAVRDDGVAVTVSSWNVNQDTGKMAAAVEEALRDIKTVLQQPV